MRNIGKILITISLLTRLHTKKDKPVLGLKVSNVTINITMSEILRRMVL